jgi:hypothetical protein
VSNKRVELGQREGEVKDSLVDRQSSLCNREGVVDLVDEISSLQGTEAEEQEK